MDAPLFHRAQARFATPRASSSSTRTVADPAPTPKAAKAEAIRTGGPFFAKRTQFSCCERCGASTAWEFVDIDFSSTKTAAIRGCVVIPVDGVTNDLLRRVIKVIAPGCRGEVVEARCPH